MEKIRRIVLFIGVISFIIFLGRAFYGMHQGQKEFVNKQYNGIITEIRKLQGRRDLPDIKINSQWISLNILESKVKHNIQVGDSIVKESGTEIIKVYRKNLNGEWDVKIFK